MFDWKYHSLDLWRYNVNYNTARHQEEQQQHHLKHTQILINNPNIQKLKTQMIISITIRVDVQIFLFQWNGFNQYFQDSMHVKQSFSFVPIWPTLYPPLESKMFVSVFSSRNLLIPSSLHGITFVNVRCCNLFLFPP